MQPMMFRQLPSDPGLEPPLSAEGERVEALVIGRVNPRWMAGIILTGIAGAGLLLLSVRGALAPMQNIVRQAQIVKSKEDVIHQPGASTALRRGDKLIRRINLVAARQDYKVPINVRVGASEVTRQFAFTRLAVPLALESLGYAEVIPPFNLAKLVSLASEDRTAIEAEAGGVPDSEVALLARVIEKANPLPDSGIALKEEDALAQVQDLLLERRREPARPGGQPSLTQTSLAQSSLAKVMRAPNEGAALSAFTSGVSDPFSKIVVKMVPENVSLLPRQDAILAPFPVEERVILTKGEAATTQTLKAAGATPAQIQQIISALTRGKQANTLDGNRILKLTLQPSEPNMPKELMRVELFYDEELVASTARRDDGTFVSIQSREVPVQKQVPVASAANEDEDEEVDANPNRLTLYASIHETARRYDIAPNVIDDVIRAVFFDVDLQRRVSPGDQIEMLVAEGEGQKQELQLVSLNAAGTKRRYYRFKLPEDEIVDFFDDQGRSVKQFLLRKPIDGGELRSRFGMRKHPILRYYRLHSGVDWADRVGTPIRAAGSGTVRLAEWDSGYGRRVEIEHNHGYVTTYSHMSAFAPGIKEGVKVRQGQIIGRLGSSGLSTGPHLHYEVMINERFVDPLAIRLPRGRELAGQQLNDFRRERDQMEMVLKRAPGASALVAQN
jgi:murein DD-endopeptidase MepM/ murein hydrolase activator NlpD